MRHVQAAAFGHDGGVQSMFPRPIKLSVNYPKEAIDELDFIASEESLLGFIEVMWPVLEPGRKFIKGKAIRAICEHLEAVSRGDIRKLLINVPPGCMKSLTTCVFWPAWEWGPQRRPNTRYVCASYSQDLTLRDNRRCRQVLRDEKYQRLWGDVFTIVSDQDAKGKFENDHRGWKIATSVHGTTTGERGDRVIVDDPHNIKDVESDRVRESTLQWFTEVLPSRVNSLDDDTFVVIMQRVHERDVSGLILAKDLGYEYLCLPMEFEDDHPHPCRNTIGFRDWRTTPGELLWPERFSEKAVEDLKTSLRSWGGGYAEAGQLQQRPAPRGGGMFKRKWWKFFETNATGYLLGRPNGCSQETAEELPKLDWIVMSVDAAFKDSQSGSRVSIMVVGGKLGKRFLLDNITDHMTFKETCDTIVQVDARGRVTGGVLKKWLPQCTRVLIEDKANGPAIIDTLRNLVPGIIAINPQGGKESRASAIQPSVESGNVLLPDGAPWLEDFISEFASFPVGARDDQVDALSQALIYMTDSSDVARAIGLANL